MLVPIAEITSPTIERVYCIEIQRALMKHTSATFEPGPKKTECIDKLDECAALLSKVQHQLNEMIKHGNIEVCFETDEQVQLID